MCRRACGRISWLCARWRPHTGLWWSRCGPGPSFVKARETRAGGWRARRSRCSDRSAPHSPHPTCPLAASPSQTTPSSCWRSATTMTPQEATTGRRRCGSPRDRRSRCGAKPMMPQQTAGRQETAAVRCERWRRRRRGSWRGWAVSRRRRWRAPPAAAAATRCGSSRRQRPVRVRAPARAAAQKLPGWPPCTAPAARRLRRSGARLLFGLTFAVVCLAGRQRIRV